MCCSVLQCVAVCCSVLQCVAVCCSVLSCMYIHICTLAHRIHIQMRTLRRSTPSQPRPDTQHPFASSIPPEHDKLADDMPVSVVNWKFVVVRSIHFYICCTLPYTSVTRRSVNANNEWETIGMYSCVLSCSLCACMRTCILIYLFSN